MTGLTGDLIFLQTARISPDAAFALTDWTANVIFIVGPWRHRNHRGPILGVLVFFALRSSLADYGGWYLMIARPDRHRRDAVRAERTVV